jgi:hypothetical protein
MDKFMRFKIKLLKKIQDKSTNPYYERAYYKLYYDYYLDLDRIWKSYLRIKDINDLNVMSQVKQTFKSITPYRNIYTTSSYDGDYIAYSKLVKTLHKVGFKQCGVELKGRPIQCLNVCTVEQGKCGVHSRKERRKVEIHQFLKVQFDPIGLRDVVKITEEYVL